MDINYFFRVPCGLILQCSLVISLLLKRGKDDKIYHHHLPCKCKCANYISSVLWKISIVRLLPRAIYALHHSLTCLCCDSPACRGAAILHARVVCLPSPHRTLALRLQRLPLPHYPSGRAAPHPTRPPSLAFPSMREDRRAARGTVDVHSCGSTGR